MIPDEHTYFAICICLKALKIASSSLATYVYIALTVRSGPDKVMLTDRESQFKPDFSAISANFWRFFSDFSAISANFWRFSAIFQRFWPIFGDFLAIFQRFRPIFGQVMFCQLRLGWQF
jgi:hypothetical protein